MSKEEDEVRLIMGLANPTRMQYKSRVSDEKLQVAANFRRIGWCTFENATHLRDKHHDDGGRYGRILPMIRRSVALRYAGVCTVM